MSKAGHFVRRALALRVAEVGPNKVVAALPLYGYRWPLNRPATDISYDEARRESPRLTLLAWLTVVVKRVAIDYMRALPEYVDRRREAGATSPGAWRKVGTLPSESRLRRTAQSPSGRAADRELMELAGAVLSDEQRPALSAWLEGASFEEIAARLELTTADDAEKRVRAAVRRIRRHLGGES